MGQLSTSASGAVGVVSSLMAIIQALGFMLGHGAGSIISRSLGQRDTETASRFASTSFFTALAFGAVLAVGGLATLTPFMRLLGSTETILPHARAYAFYILLAAPPMMSSLVMNNILRYEGKACIIVINKWDAVEGKETNTMELQRRGYSECFSFMSYAPIIFISAQTGYNVNKLMQLIRDVDSQNGARVPTGVLNEMLARATARMQPPSDKGRRLKIFYLTQASTRPPTFVAFVNAKHLFHFSYQRYIINQIRENFGLENTPIRLVVRERGAGEVRAKDV